MKATWIIQEPSVILFPKPNKDNTTENYNSVAFMKGPYLKANQSKMMSNRYSQT